MTLLWICGPCVCTTCECNETAASHSARNRHSFSARKAHQARLSLLSVCRSDKLCTLSPRPGGKTTSSMGLESTNAADADVPGAPSMSISTASRARRPSLDPCGEQQQVPLFRLLRGACPVIPTLRLLLLLLPCCNNNGDHVALEAVWIAKLWHQQQQLSSTDPATCQAPLVNQRPATM